MRAEVQSIDPNEFLDWRKFADHEPPDPVDDFGWFTLTIGVEGDDGGNHFQVCVSTPKAISRITTQQRAFVIVVDHFDADTVERAIHDKVSSVTGHSWDQIVDRLRKFMLWEYEGMAGR